MNMFKSVKATTYQEYFDALSPERRTILEFIEKFIKTKTPGLKPNFLYNMPGYGSFKSKNSKKQMIDWPTVAVASQKDYVSLYVCAVQDGKYLAESYKDKLGKVSVGKSCVRFKKIEDLNLDGLEELLKLAEKYPGLEGLSN